MKFAVKDVLIVNLIHYPVCPSLELAVGAGRHADVSLITMLLQDDIICLYIREPKGEGWIHVPPVKRVLVINIGDVLQIMSNDRYKSIEHRVIVSASKNIVSVSIFVNPAPDAVFGPLKQVLENREKPFHKQVV
ncbi:Feruloyl CoA ortho-hydroxylase 2 [Capsicum baccatum]|uniref:Feruloyl CoA ortho-hydroxylase 2 n=1 Tax=Capsicum baccatum TaxID=33114 RepID=A0A2G2XQ49_CAPBA|nr:Feruloyl CoA ortho-hydroxylase 2 [Capsicum baccatum]